MRTAKFLMSQSLFFELIGLKDFGGDIIDVKVIQDSDLMEVLIEGTDNRLPDKDNFPDCHVIIKTVTARFEEIDK